MLVRKSIECIAFSLFWVGLASFGTSSAVADPMQMTLPLDAPEMHDPDAQDARVLFLVVDFAGILQIEGGMSAIAVGNPNIVDTNMANHRTVILTGLMAGTTNLIALDDAGTVLADVMVHVGSQKPGTVTVRRGTQLQAYSCTSGPCEGTGNDQAGAIPVAGTDG